MRSLMFAALAAAVACASYTVAQTFQIPAEYPGVNTGPDAEGWYFNVERNLYWRWLDAATRRPLEASPPERLHAPKELPPPTPPVEQNFGVVKSKLDGSKPKILHRGREITREQALDLVGGKEIPNDSDKLRLTVIGDEETRKAVILDLLSHRALSHWTDKLAVQVYDPTHWAVSGFRVPRGGMAICLQKPDGTVLHRQADYEDGAEGLAVALRKADPNYDPSQDPDARKPEPPPEPEPKPDAPKPDPAKPSFDLSKVPTIAWVVAAIGIFLVLKKEEK